MTPETTGPGTPTASTAPQTTTPQATPPQTPAAQPPTALPAADSGGVRPGPAPADADDISALSPLPGQPGPLPPPDAASASSSDTAQPPAISRWADRVVETLWRPLAVFVVSALAQLLVLAWMIPSGGPSLRNRLMQWDAVWYVDVAAHGYPHGYSYTAEGDLTGNTLAFFPLFSGLVRLVHTVTGLDYDMAGLVTAHLCTAAALCVVYLLFTRLYDRRTGVIMAVLVGAAQPMSVVFSMAYAESLFLALSAAVLLAARREAWLTAGVCALGAALTRPTAVATTAALVTAVGIVVWRQRRLHWRQVAAVALGCVGTPLYLLWVGLRVGSLNAYFTIQDAGWGTHWDYGRAFGTFLRDTLRTGDGWVAVSTAVLALAALWAAVTALTQRPWPPLAVYGVLVLLLTFGQSNYYHSKMRQLLPVLLVLVPLARVLARARTRTAVLALVPVCAFGMWYGAYMLTTWHYGI